ncbi:MAG: putative nitrogen-fixing protein NifU [Cyanobacteria bacterium RYN_339]|nr:putative nitrogen-fixing protein NifU [Cyanobacteria bacterium RYN_339]
MKVMNFEPTPNPNAMKFNVDGKLIEGGSRSYDTPAAADGDPLATALFALGKVQTVFYMPGFVTVSKLEGAEWSALAPAIARTIETTAVTPVSSDASAGIGGEGGLMDKINRVLDAQIRPALAGDGGGLEVVALEGLNLQIRYQGACGSCPSSIAGTLAAIQNLLQAEVDEGLVVTAG